MKIIVLAYHSQNINGNHYEDNDHIALREDLAELRKHGIPLISLRDLSCALQSDLSPADMPKTAVALSCDDGTVLDWENFTHPVHGPQSSFTEILIEHMDILRDRRPHLLTSFVIASPEARRQIDAHCHAGYELSSSHWWKTAAQRRLISIENHSWDHLHPCLDTSGQNRGKNGNFRLVDTYADADQQIRQATNYINKALEYQHRTSLFAYPFGHFNDYLVNDYFPNHKKEHEIVAAFTTEPDITTEASNIYKLPRYVHGEAWSTPAEFKKIIDQLKTLY